MELRDRPLGDHALSFRAPEPRPELLGVEPAVHGGPSLPELEDEGIGLEELLDFSVCTNPFGPPPQVREALRDLEVHLYPDSQCTALRRELGERMGVSPEEVLVGSGSTNLIRYLALAFLRSGDLAVIPKPTFGEYEIASRIMGAAVFSPSPSDPDLRFAFEELLRAASLRPRIFFLCNPNNPTGQYFPPEFLEKLSEPFAEGGGILAVDEAYISFVEGGRSPLHLRSRNVVFLRSMTKDFALAGLRLGYLVARPEITRELRRVLPPWEVNVAAQIAGLAALRAEGFVERSRRKLLEARDFLIQSLSRLGFRILPSEAHFFLMEVGNAAEFRRRLLRRKILVRDCASFGLPHLVRISPKALPDCEKLVKAVKEVRDEGA